MGVLVIGCCLGFPAIITGVIIPYLNGIHPYFYLGSKGFFYFDTLVMLGLMAFILLFLVIGAFLGSREGRTIAPYLGGRAVDSEGRFLGSLGVYKEAKTSNYYLEEYCGEKALLKPSWVISGVLIIVMLVLGFMGVMIWI